MRIDLLVAVAALATPACAGILTYQFSGVVTKVEGPGPVAVGTAYEFQYRLNSNIPDAEPNPVIGRYPSAILEAEVDLGGIFHLETGPGDITIINDPAGDVYGPAVESSLGSVQILLIDASGQAFTTDHLPQLVHLADFGIRSFRLSSTSGPEAWTVEGDVRMLLMTYDDCFIDCNIDGYLNLADFGCFTTKFAFHDPFADCNGDNQWTLSDFGCFQTKFALGCP